MMTWTPLFRLALIVFLSLCSRLTGLGATYAQITSAEMNNNGAVAFRAILNGGDIFPAGVFLSLPGTPTVAIAVEGAESAVAGLKYHRLSDRLAFNNQADVLFPAMLDDEVGAVFLFDKQDRAVRVLLEAADLPEGHLLVVDSASFDLNDAGDAAFSVLASAPCSSPPCSSLVSKWQLYFSDSRTGETRVIAEAEQLAPGGGTIQGFEGVRLNEQGAVVFQTRINPEQQGLFRYSQTNGLERLLATGEPLAGFGGRRIL
ncbi:MAG: hypothetical protein EHM61_04290, partial [Acidobacteria bacterium]